MTEEIYEELAKFAAETLNGGDFYDERFYQNKHREAWVRMVKALLDKDCEIRAQEGCRTITGATCKSL